MVYLIKDNGKQILYGLSTDDKDASLDLVTTKTDVIVYREVDTGKEYIYNTGEWYEQAGSGGGGGGGGGDIDLGITGASVGEYAKIKTVDADGVPTAWESGGGGGGILVVHVNSGTLDKTWQEIADAGFAIILDDSLPFVGTQISVLADFKADEEEPEYLVSFINLFNLSAGIDTYGTETTGGYPVLNNLNHRLYGR